LRVEAVAKSDQPKWGLNEVLFMPAGSGRVGLVVGPTGCGMTTVLIYPGVSGIDRIRQ
jgi:hypothetical protein